MVSGKGQIKLTDFGIAKDLDATALTATGRTLGTAAYMAPEQIRGTPEISHKTDLYALGILIYQMLTGQQAFEGTSAVVLMHCHLNEPPPKPRAKTPDIPVELDDLVVRLMAKSPADRPWDAAAVGHTLRELREKVNRGEAVKMARPAEAAGATNPTRAGLEHAETVATTAKAVEAASPGPGPPAGGRSRRGSSPACWSWAWRRSAGSSATGSGPRAPSTSSARPRRGWPRRTGTTGSTRATITSTRSIDASRTIPTARRRRAWRDRILLNEAEERARVLASPLGIKLTEPKDENEQHVRALQHRGQRVRGARQRTRRDRAMGDDGASAPARRSRAAPLVPARPQAGRRPQEVHRPARGDWSASCSRAPRRPTPRDAPARRWPSGARSSLATASTPTSPTS